MQISMKTCAYGDRYADSSPNERGGGGGQNLRARASMGPGPFELRPLLVTRHAPSGLIDNEWLSSFGAQIVVTNQRLGLHFLFNERQE